MNLTKLTDALQGRVTAQDDEIQQLRALAGSAAGSIAMTSATAMEGIEGMEGMETSEDNTTNNSDNGLSRNDIEGTNGLTIYPPLPGSEVGTPSPLDVDDEIRGAVAAATASSVGAGVGGGVGSSTKVEDVDIHISQ